LIDACGSGSISAWSTLYNMKSAVSEPTAPSTPMTIAAPSAATSSLDTEASRGAARTRDRLSTTRSVSGHARRSRATVTLTLAATGACKFNILRTSAVCTSAAAMYA
jgi:hypothetical protein